MGTATYSPYVINLINLVANHVARGELAGCTHFSRPLLSPRAAIPLGTRVYVRL